MARNNYTSDPADSGSDDSSLTSLPRHTPTPPASPSISSDTSGSVSPEPRSFNPRASAIGSVGAGAMPIAGEEADSHEQVTECLWVGCTEGDLGDMDALVKHIHDDHIGARKSKYTCEWEGCPRKGMNHASGYALRAHMRSHTREKPFYCMLPECDRSFTRSDALAKHMRTVHETEALRPSDPVPKGHSSHNPVATPSHTKTGKRGRKSGKTTEPEYPEEYDPVQQKSGGLYTAADGFSDDEIKYKPRELHAYLSRKIEVLEKEKRELEKERDHWRERHRRNYAIKEKLLDDKAYSANAKFRVWKAQTPEEKIGSEDADGEGYEDADADGEEIVSEGELARDEEGDLIMEG